MKSVYLDSEVTYQPRSIQIDSNVVPLLWLCHGRNYIAVVPWRRVPGSIPVALVSGRAAKHSCSCAKSEDLRVTQPV